MLTIELGSELEKRLAELAKANNQSVKDWLSELLQNLLKHQEYLEDLADIREAEKVHAAIEQGEEETYSLEEVKQELGL